MKTTDDFPFTDPLPWSSTDAAIDLRIPLAKDGAHPCADCPAPCCQVVVARRSQIIEGEDLSLLERYLSYQNVVAWIEDGGSYAIVITAPCSWLDRETLGCSVHGTQEQPRICDKYDAHNCWYRKCNGPIPPGRLKLDRSRWDAYRRAATVLPNGLLMGLPPTDEDPPKSPVVFDTPASLAFEIPNKRIDDDYLYFLSNFEAISLARMVSCWVIIYDTLRVSGSVPVVEERSEAPPGVQPAEDVVFLTGAELRRVRAKVPRGLVELGPEELREYV